MRRPRREARWWLLKPARLGSASSSGPLPTAPLPVHLANESWPGLAVKSCAEEKLWVNSSTGCSLCFAAGVARESRASGLNQKGK